MPSKQPAPPELHRAAACKVWAVTDSERKAVVVLHHGLGADGEDVDLPSEAAALVSALETFDRENQDADSKLQVGLGLVVRIEAELAE